MVGCGETDDEVLEAHARRCARPTSTSHDRPIPAPDAEARRRSCATSSPQSSSAIAQAGLELGFKYVASGPLVRSSYRAAEAFLDGILRGHDAPVHAIATAKGVWRS